MLDLDLYTALDRLEDLRVEMFEKSLPIYLTQVKINLRNEDYIPLIYLQRSITELDQIIEDEIRDTELVSHLKKLILIRWFNLPSNLTDLQIIHIKEVVKLFGKKAVMLCKTSLHPDDYHLFMILIFDGTEYVSYRLNSSNYDLVFGEYYGENINFNSIKEKFVTRVYSKHDANQVIWLNDASVTALMPD